MQSTTNSAYLSPMQKALATTIARGANLFTEGGYTIEPYGDRPGVYAVSRGANDPRPLRHGESLWNDVDVCNQTCTCRGFEFMGACKHLEAATKALAGAARLLGPMLPAPTPEASWPPADRAEGAAFGKRFADMTPAEKAAQIDRDFG